jgi:hypothetical protein
VSGEEEPIATQFHGDEGNGKTMAARNTQRGASREGLRGSRRRDKHAGGKPRTTLSVVERQRWSSSVREAPRPRTVHGGSRPAAESQAFVVQGERTTAGARGCDGRQAKTALESSTI